MEKSLLGGLFAPRILQADGAIEDSFFSGQVIFAVGNEVAGALELAEAAGQHRSGGGLDFGGDDAEGIGIEATEETVFLGIGILDAEEAVVESHLGIAGGGGIDPMDRGAALDTLGGVCSGGAFQQFAANFGDLTVGIFLEGEAFDDVAAAQSDVATGAEAVEFFRRVFEEVALFDPQLAAVGERALAPLGSLGVLHDGGRDEFIGGNVFEHDFERFQHGHAAGCLAVEIGADFKFEQIDAGGAVEFRDADVLAEIANGGGGVAASAQAGNGREARVVPAGDVTFFYQEKQFAFAHDGVGQIQSSELDLARLGGHGAVLDDPVVEWAVIFKF